MYSGSTLPPIHILSVLPFPLAGLAGANTTAGNQERGFSWTVLGAPAPQQHPLALALFAPDPSLEQDSPTCKPWWEGRPETTVPTLPHLLESVKVYGEPGSSWWVLDVVLLCVWRGSSPWGAPHHGSNPMTGLQHWGGGGAGSLPAGLRPPSHS